MKSFFSFTRFKPSNIVLFDQAETPLHELALELEEIYGFKNFKMIIGDLINEGRLNYIMERL